MELAIDYFPYFPTLYLPFSITRGKNYLGLNAAYHK